MEVTSYELQTRVLIVFLMHETLLEERRSAISPEIWIAAEHQSVARSMLTYYDKYHHMPGWVELLDILNRNEKPPVNLGTWREYVKALQRIYKQSPDQLQYVYDRTDEFIRHRLMGWALSQAVDSWEARRYDDALRAVREYEQTNSTFGEGLTRSNGVTFRVTESLVNGVTASTALTASPKLLPEALIGVTGEWVRLIEPISEAHPAALLLQLLTALGNAIGRRAYVQVEKDRHYPNLFTLLASLTGAGKGTALGHVRTTMKGVDTTWRDNTGLSSGEGLIWAVRDAINVTRKGKTYVTDPGVVDKRKLFVAGEFTHILNVLARTGNTLSDVLRDAWDGLDLAITTKNTPARATSPHISLIGHITKDELLKRFSSTEASSGFGNRFLWVWVERTKSLPFGGRMDKKEEQELKRLTSFLQSMVATVPTAHLAVKPSYGPFIRGPA
jgi:hypothetical protein